MNDSRASTADAPVSGKAAVYRIPFLLRFPEVGPLAPLRSLRHHHVAVCMTTAASRTINTSQTISGIASGGPFRAHPLSSRKTVNDGLLSRCLNSSSRSGKRAQSCGFIERRQARRTNPSQKRLPGRSGQILSSGCVFPL